jgi:hypothetical protein
MQSNRVLASRSQIPPRFWVRVGRCGVRTFSVVYEYVKAVRLRTSMYV